MTLAIREIGRNVHIFSVNDPTTTLGGLVCTEGITNNNFYVMVRIILEFENDFTLHDEIGSTVPRDDQCLKPGNYAILTTGSVNLSTELWLPRTSDATTETQNEPFRTAVRERDGGCVITGQPAENGRFGFWQGFKAVHIFPPSLEQYWSDYNFTAWITPTGSDDPINSVHNGILLDSQMCNLFENYIISINPDVCITSTFFKLPCLIFWLGQL